MVENVPIQDVYETRTAIVTEALKAPKAQKAPKAPKKKVEPKKRVGYNICNVRWARKEFKWLLKNNPKQEQESFVNAIISSCATGVGKGAHISAQLPRIKRPMNGWNCYLRWCKDQNAGNQPLDFATCMKSSDKYKDSLGWQIRQTEYNGKEDYWKQEAKKGC